MSLGNLLFHRWILLVPSDKNPAGGSKQDHFCDGMGKLSVYSYALWIEKFPCGVF
jgi:hypothetical protein